MSGMNVVAAKQEPTITFFMFEGGCRPIEIPSSEPCRCLDSSVQTNSASGAQVGSTAVIDSVVEETLESHVQTNSASGKPTNTVYMGEDGPKGIGYFTHEDVFGN